MLKPSAFSVTLALVVVAQLSGVAQSAPLPNLVLACSDESAIGRDFGSCHNYAYQVPTNQLIVFSGSSLLWSTASDLAGSDLVLVCTIPVEPGAYSSCRDAAGIRRSAFVPKDSVITGGRNSVIVSKTGGDYTDPVTAAENAFAGDTWCVAPQWPLQPCVMAIGEGVFILPKTLSIPEGLAVSGNGKGDTMLVADNGVETAVSSFGNVRISDLTIVNSQPGGARTTGLKIDESRRFGVLVQLHDAAIHVSGAAQNVAVLRGESIEILDSEITAVGEDTTAMSNLNPGPPDLSTRVTVERSLISAEVAFHEEFGGPAGASLRLLDSRVFGRVFYNHEGHLLEIIGTEIVGSVTAINDFVNVVITDSSIKGSVGARGVAITNTNVEGRVGGSASGIIDGLTVHGQLQLDSSTRVVRSYIDNSASTAPALFIRSSNVQLDQTFVQGTQAVVVDRELGSRQGQLEASSSVLAGPVSGSAGSVLSCSDTYGVDYELLSATCQPQAP